VISIMEVLERCKKNAQEISLGADVLAAQETARRERADADRRESLRKRSLIPPRFAGKTLEQLAADGENSDAISAAKAVVVGGFEASLGLYGGDVGAGKTTIGAAILNAAIDALSPARMLTVVTLVDALHEASKYGSDEDVTQIVGEFARTPVLMLDDLGREPVTRRSLSWLYELLNRRWNECKPLIVTTNLGFEGLLQRYTDACVRAGEPESTADAIIDRLRGIVPLDAWHPVSGRSRR
jgi:DNA replication protein DnaC